MLVGRRLLVQGKEECENPGSWLWSSFFSFSFYYRHVHPTTSSFYSWPESTAIRTAASCAFDMALLTPKAWSAGDFFFWQSVSLSLCTVYFRKLPWNYIAESIESWWHLKAFKTFSKLHLAQAATVHNLAMTRVASLHAPSPLNRILSELQFSLTHFWEILTISS